MPRFALLGNPVPDLEARVIEHPQLRVVSGTLTQRGHGKQMSRAELGLCQRGVIRDVIDVVVAHRIIGLAPSVRVTRNVGSLQHGSGSGGAVTLGIDDARSAIEHAADGIHARGAQIVQEVPAPVLVTSTFLELVANGWFDGLEIRSVVGIASLVVEVAVVVDRVRLVAHVDHTVTVQIGGVVIGLVIQLVIAPQHQHVQRRQGLAHEQRRLR
ncbi:hypothetical protein SDC9_104048 [bioreactor metagenome]|uniref:Uncharacterized protein n=1 Tax=bioreactor metagenome TaxID=1076179 RepID=A0A645AWQ3_9ZZZZ